MTFLNTLTVTYYTKLNLDHVKFKKDVEIMFTFIEFRTTTKNKSFHLKQN